jgi:hypothetical protein
MIEIKKKKNTIFNVFIIIEPQFKTLDSKIESLLQAGL